MKHFLVVDLEATCCDDNSFPRTEMEIIEVGAVMVQSATNQPVAEFQSFMRPARNPTLTDFCRDLTGITQPNVDAAPAFADVLANMLVWAADFAPYTLCSWGNYDRTQFHSDCDYHSVNYPFGDKHINLKADFASATGRRKKMGVPAALRSVGLSFVGSHHRGIDDARSIAAMIPYISPASFSAGGG
jgi:inhibitor of KinA sporulation pathway (predicted exonuclease)